MKKDERIKIHFSKKNQHISLASNKALELSSGQFICMLDHIITTSFFTSFSENN